MIGTVLGSGVVTANSTIIVSAFLKCVSVKKKVDFNVLIVIKEKLWVLESKPQGF